MIPTTPLAPFVNTASVLAAPNQPLQQFPVNLSNPPGQTVDWFFNVLSVIYNLLIRLQSSASNTTDVAAYATDSIQIIQSIYNQVQTSYAFNSQWSVPLVPFKGWAANNTVNSGNNSLNIKGIVDSIPPSAGSAGLGSSIAFLLYYWLYAFHTETSNANLQINHYTFNLLSEIQVQAYDYNGVEVTQSVALWIQLMTQQLQAQITLQNSPPWDQFFASQVGGSAYEYIKPVLDTVTIGTTEILTRIPPPFLLSPYTGLVSDYESNIANAAHLPLILLVIFINTFYNNLTAIASALNKISILRDPQTNVLVFEQASTNVQNALQLLYGTKGYLTNLTENIVTLYYNSPLDNQKYGYATAFTTKSARTSSVDANRINGSLVPTLNNVLQLWQVTQYFAQQIQDYGSSGSVVCSPPFNAYTSEFQKSIQDIVSDTSITTSLQTAITSFDSQLYIHYSRWQQNLSNI